MIYRDLLPAADRVIALSSGERPLARQSRGMGAVRRTKPIGHDARQVPDPGRRRTCPADQGVQSSRSTLDPPGPCEATLGMNGSPWLVGAVWLPEKTLRYQAAAPSSGPP